MATVAPRQSFADAIHSPAFEEMLPRLVAYARRRLGRRASGDEAVELLDEAIVRCLQTDRTWPEAIGLEDYLCGVMWSLASHRHRRAVRWVTARLDDVPEIVDPFPSCDDELDARRLLASVLRVLAGDSDIEALLALLARGVVKRADVAAELGWTPEQVTAVRERMKRRLAAVGLYPGEDDERSERARSTEGAAAPWRRAR